MNSCPRGAVSQFNFSDLRIRLLGVAGLLCFTFFQPNYGTAQIVQPHRFERPQKKHLYNYTVISLEEEGLALLQDGRKSKNNNLTWQIVLVDTALQERNKFEFSTNEQSKYIGYQVEPGRLFLLFRVNQSIKNSFELIEISLSKVQVKQYSVDPGLNFEYTHFAKVGNSLAFGGYSHEEPVVFVYSLISKTIAVVPTFFKSSSKLINVVANTNQTFNVISVDRALPAFQFIVNGDRNFIFRTYDQYGKLLLEDKTPIDDEKMLQVGITSTLGHEDLFTFGTWGGLHSDKSFGLFSIGVDPTTNQNITYYNLGELNHYLDYLDPKSAEKIKRTMKGQKDKKNPEFSDYVIPYKVVEYKDGYLLLAEASTFENLHLNNPYTNRALTSGYDPRNTLTAQYYYPGTDPRSLSVYDYKRPTKKSEQEVKKNETILISFDAQGKLMWDYSFNLNGIRVSTPKQISDFALTGDRIFFLYKDGDRLNSKSIELKGGLSNEMEEKIESLDPHDLVQTDKDNQGEVKYWYGNSFYVWGYQTIKNATKEQRSRNVLYVNKIVAH